MSEVSSVYVYNEGIGRGAPTDVTHIRVDPSVTAIPFSAFYSFEQLEVVELPEGLIKITEDGFSCCKSLKKINLPSTLVEIEGRSFSSCESLEVVVLPVGLQMLGEYTFSICKSLQRINIPPNLRTIDEGAFAACRDLTDITFSEGLEYIEKGAFARCVSLSSINLPSTLKAIGEESFYGCEKLNEIHLPDAIHFIYARAFTHCNITHFRIPPQMYGVDISILSNNACLVSLELPENLNSNIRGIVNRIEDTAAYTVLGSLRNITVPSNCKVSIDITRKSKDLRVAFPEGDNDTITEALQNRFDDLPIHKICYYQSYHDNETIQNSKREIGESNKSVTQQDCLGMTPLHILACSTKQHVEVYQLLIDKYPETLIMKDKWGDIPLLYAIWCNASAEVLDLFVESYKSFHPDYEFDWSGMIQTLAKRAVPLANIQKLVNTQHESFPGQEYDMQAIVMELAVHDASELELVGRWVSMKTFRYLLRLSITDRLDLLNITKWQVDMENYIALPMNLASRESNTQAIYDRLATYESIKEGTSILELALWKAKIGESRSNEARVSGEVRSRDQCRINCGADIIIRNALPYLLPKRTDEL